MKRRPIAFFPLCRKWLIVALLAMNLSSCANLGSSAPPEAAILFPLFVITSPIWMPVSDIINAPERRERKKKAEIDSAAAQTQESLVQKARAYLQTACAKEERLSIKSGILLDDGILALGNNRGNAPLPLQETAPNESAPAAILEYRSYHYRENREESIRAFREIQYGYALPWDTGNLLAAAWVPVPQTGNQKAFIETSDGKYIQRASRAFWERAKLRDRVLESSLQMKALRNDKWSEADILMNYATTPMWMPFDLPVDTLNARYALSIEDISTLEDRANWVGRGRLRLIERDTGEVVAEYIGFAANNYLPAMRKQYASRLWDLAGMEVCPNAGKTFGRNRGDTWSHTWSPARGFLHSIKRAQGKAVANFAALIPPEPNRYYSWFLVSPPRFTREDGSLWVEDTALSDFMSLPLPESSEWIESKKVAWKSVSLVIPAEKPLPSMIWRNVFLSKSVDVTGMVVRAEDNAVFGSGKVTVAGNLLIEGVDGQGFGSRYITPTGDLTVRDSEFALTLSTMGTPHMLLERVRGGTTYLSPYLYWGNESYPRTKRAIFRFCSGPFEIRIDAEHVRIENSTGSFNFSYESRERKSRIDRLEIVGSRLEWINLKDAEIDRLEITGSSIDGINLEGARIRQWKVTNSRIKKDGHYLEDWQIKLMGEKAP
ncbi:MAG: hypothetical protein LBQ75_00095 [Zoogloeaceae bacterium]|jgi:hypothetical protein|nr:hypothetical protein [Zoogloeaceae bacterium]